jgi:hypothetical protein
MNNANNEPTLESIGDYNTLKGSKKKIVWSVILVGLVIGAVYATLNSNYSNVDDQIKINDPIKSAERK